MDRSGYVPLCVPEGQLVPAKVDRRIRVQRWDDATATMMAIQAACAAWFDALPENLHDSATAAASQEIMEFDLEVIAAIRRRRGYGRD